MRSVCGQNDDDDSVMVTENDSNGVEPLLENLHNNLVEQPDENLDSYLSRGVK